MATYESTTPNLALAPSLAPATAPTAEGPVVERAVLLQVGLEVIPVYGDDDMGWTMDEGDHGPHTARQFRYRSLDELFFALVNYMVAPPGSGN